MKPVGPIYTAELFPPLSRELQNVLTGLAPEQWNSATACVSWDVKDVAAHLLGGNFGRLWKPSSESLTDDPGPAFETVVSQINRDNDLWVRAARRISPDVLIELLALTDNQLYEKFQRLDPHEPAPITVAWAGDSISPNWFDIAREYTEKWLHQQHIRDAVGLTLLLEKEWYYPVLDTFLRGLPHLYQSVEAAPGTSLVVEVGGPAGGWWTLIKGQDTWQLFSGDDKNADCAVTIDPDLAWRVFTKGADPEAALSQVEFKGNKVLGWPVLELVSIMA